MKQTKRILAWILTMTLLLGMLPGLASTAWAAETEETAEPTREETVPVMTEEVTPETTEETVPETTEATVPETTEAVTPETTKATEETVPETTEATIPETTEETVSETTWETVPEERLTEEAMLSIGTNEYGETTFENFADLKYLTEQTYSSRTNVEYSGIGNLVISESITIPKNLYVHVPYGQITVPEESTLVLDGDMIVGSLAMNGIMYTNGSLSANYELNIFGPFHLAGRIYMQPGAKLYGDANIDYVGSSAHITMNYNIYSAEDWKNAVETAKKQYIEHVTNNLYIKANITLEESATTGNNTNIYIQYATLQVPARCTLELNGPAYINDSLLVEGTLVNNKILYIYYPYGGTMQIAEGGAYSGIGALNVYCEDTSAIQSVVPGLNLSKFQAIKHEDYNTYWQLKPIREPIVPDFDGSGVLNTDDALHLVLNLSFADRFPLHGDGDLNSDGRVNTDDALYLVLHLSFPDRFPLYP